MIQIKKAIIISISLILVGGVGYYLGKSETGEMVETSKNHLSKENKPPSYNVDSDTKTSNRIDNKHHNDTKVLRDNNRSLASDNQEPQLQVDVPFFEFSVGTYYPGDEGYSTIKSNHNKDVQRTYFEFFGKFVAKAELVNDDYIYRLSLPTENKELHDEINKDSFYSNQINTIDIEEWGAVDDDLLSVVEGRLSTLLGREFNIAEVSCQEFKCPIILQPIMRLDEAAQKKTYRIIRTLTSQIENEHSKYRLSTLYDYYNETENEYYFTMAFFTKSIDDMMKVASMKKGVE